MVEEEIMTTLIAMITNRRRCWRKTAGGSGGQTTPVSGQTGLGWWCWGGQQAAGSRDGVRFDSAVLSLCQSTTKSSSSPVTVMMQSYAWCRRVGRG